MDLGYPRKKVTKGVASRRDTTKAVVGKQWKMGMGELPEVAYAWEMCIGLARCPLTYPS